ncbi:MAG: VCBS repeat-containing protein [Pseudomonadota bacterium]
MMRREKIKVCGFVGLLLIAPIAYSEAFFTDQAEASGIDFVHFNGMSGEFYFVENVGSGVALFDYDNDGDLDVYLSQGHMLGKGKSLDDALFPPVAGERFLDRLYRNDLVVHKDGRRSLRFTDVTETSGLRASGYGMGVAVGDYDNDGWRDLYLTNFGHDPSGGHTGAL